MFYSCLVVRARWTELIGADEKLKRERLFVNYFKDINVSFLPRWGRVENLQSPKKRPRVSDRYPDRYSNTKRISNSKEDKMNKCQLNQRNFGNFVSSAGEINRPMTRFGVYIKKKKKKKETHVYAYSVYVHI